MDTEEKNMLIRKTNDINEIRKKFSNRSNVYYGHGTNTDEVVNSIFSNGLFCSRSKYSIYWTTCELGMGSDVMFDRNCYKFNNWPHFDAKKIIIISFPPEFEYVSESNQILHSALIDIKKAGNNEFSYEEGYFKSEFILGMYDVEQKVFYDNPRYYENLKEEEQQKIFEEAKRKYIDYVREAVLNTHSSYTKECNRLESLGRPNLLSYDEARALDRTLPKFDRSDMSFIDMLNMENVGEFYEPDTISMDVEDKRDCKNQKTQEQSENMSDIKDLNIDQGSVEWDR